MAPEYIDNVPYIRHFVAELSPPRLRMVAALNGCRPPPATDFDYCELGCAHGDTLAALAAAHPNSRFLGIDLSADHVASTKRLLRDGALENAGVLERDFADLVDEDIGEFDYIVAHGVLSWVSPQTQIALMNFARAKLKPGGLFNVSYNTLPGWASIEPLRQLILFGGAAGAAAPTIERARHGLEFAATLRRSGAEYFVKNPSASVMLDTMMTAGLPYVVHEYMHEHWQPMYFARVAREMAARDLHFVGVLPVHENFPDTALSESHEQLLAKVTDRTTFESLKDFALNEFFRCDVYVKGSAARSQAVTDDYVDGTSWSALACPPGDARIVKLPYRTVALQGPTFDALFAALQPGGTTVALLSQRADLARVSIVELRRAVTTLIVCEQIIAVREARALRGKATNALYSIPSPYNQMMLRRLTSDLPIVLASPVAGTAFPISALEGVAIRMLTEVAPAGHGRWVDDLVRRNVLRLRVGDRVLEDEFDQRGAILDAVEQFRTRRLPKFIEYGILA